MNQLADAYDIIAFDLDGVIYRGTNAIPGAVSTITTLQRMGKRLGFVTNNAQRSPKVVCDHLRRLGIPCSVDDVVTSAQATAHLMAEHLPPNAQVLTLGTQALAAELDAVGLEPCRRRSADMAAVCIGYDPSLRWSDFNEACFAIQNGSIWYACNNDLNRPAAEGLAIGMGAVIAAMQAALPGQSPIMGGKPARALLDETRQRLGSGRALFVGDRLDTDIEGANNAGWDSLWVLSGSQEYAELAVSPVSQQPTFVGNNVTALLETGQGKAEFKVME
ncbi:MAG: HAD-IIA family hydrolase [Propionibacteriaceae bacterium]|jgi:HAD superfamily hydrolase (TIGR01450 family)|nr:HAD-IIA family hydrolase [Propionibacteriaceae bacterium]